VSQRRVAEKSLLLNENRMHKHEVSVDPDNPDVIMEVWVRELTFLDIQRATQEMLVMNNEGLSFSFEGYWRHAFGNFVVKTNPSLTTQELLDLGGYAGDQLSKVLPQPNDLIEEMQGGFRNPTETE